MNLQLLAEAARAAGPALQPNPALTEALRISGVALLAIFVVMGLFGALIALLAWASPAEDQPPQG